MAIIHLILHKPSKKKKTDVSLAVSSHIQRKNSSNTKLQNKFPKINNRSLDTALTFLEKQKLANCPCQVHTASRGHDWVVFRRQPDRTPTLYYEQTESESEEENQEEYNEDDDYFSVEPVDINNDENKRRPRCYWSSNFF